MKSLVFLLSVFLVVASATTLSAAPDHTHDHGEKSDLSALFGDAPLPVVWRSITASRDQIEAAFAAGKLDDVASRAETIHLAAHALADQVKTPDEAAHKRLAAALAQAAKLAEEVLAAAQHGNVRAATNSFTRLKSALTVAQGRLPAELVEAAAESGVEPRFAAAPAHAPHQH